MFTKKREKGFTLVELLVVITIMGVLGTLLVTNTQSMLIRVNK